MKKIEEILELMHHIGKKVGADISKELSDFLTNAQFYILDILMEKARTVTEIADMAGVGPSSATGIIDRMEKQGYTRRIRSKTDRRVVLIEITKEGREAYGLAKQKGLNVAIPYFSVLTEEEQQKMIELLIKIARQRGEKNE